MKNFIFISPNFPENYWEFCVELKNNGLNVARLIIHKNGTGNIIDVKLNYVHELQQAFRMCNLQYVADNFKF